MEVYYEREFSVRRGRVGKKETKEGLGSGVERDVLGEGELGRCVRIISGGGTSGFGWECNWKWIEAGERAIWIGANLEDFVGINGGCLVCHVSVVTMCAREDAMYGGREGGRDREWSYISEKKKGPY